MSFSGCYLAQGRITRIEPARISSQSAFDPWLTQLSLNLEHLNDRSSARLLGLEVQDRCVKTETRTRSSGNLCPRLLNVCVFLLQTLSHAADAMAPNGCPPMLLFRHYRADPLPAAANPLVTVCLHGFPLSGAMWAGQISLFASRGLAVVPDLRGFGDSQSTGDLTRMQDFADDVAAELTRIGQPAIVCGLSMGGYIAFELYRRSPQLVAGLILCDTRAAADSSEAAENRRKMASRVLVEGPAFVAEAMLPRLFAADTHAHQPELIVATRQTIVHTAPQAIAAAQRGMAERRDATALLPDIRVPTLVLCGEQDVISPPDEMRSIAAAIPGAEFAVIPHAGHMAPQEQPAATNVAITSWLERSFPTGDGARPESRTSSHS